jgi:hypothetical protein
VRGHLNARVNLSRELPKFAIILILLVLNDANGKVTEAPFRPHVLDIGEDFVHENLLKVSLGLLLWD